MKINLNKEKDKWRANICNKEVLILYLLQWGIDLISNLICFWTFKSYLLIQYGYCFLPSLHLQKIALDNECSSWVEESCFSFSLFTIFYLSYGNLWICLLLKRILHEYWDSDLFIILEKVNDTQKIFLKIHRGAKFMH